MFVHSHGWEDQQSQRVSSAEGTHGDSSHHSGSRRDESTDSTSVRNTNKASEKSHRSYIVAPSAVGASANARAKVQDNPPSKLWNAMLATSVVLGVTYYVFQTIVNADENKRLRWEEAKRRWSNTLLAWMQGRPNSHDGVGDDGVGGDDVRGDGGMFSNEVHQEEPTLRSSFAKGLDKLRSTFGWGRTSIPQSADGRKSDARDKIRGAVVHMHNFQAQSHLQSAAKILTGAKDVHHHHHHHNQEREKEQAAAAAGIAEGEGYAYEQRTFVMPAPDARAAVYILGTPSAAAEDKLATIAGLQPRERISKGSTTLCIYDTPAGLSAPAVKSSIEEVEKIVSRRRELDLVHADWTVTQGHAERSARRVKKMLDDSGATCKDVAIEWSSGSKNGLSITIVVNTLMR